MSRVIFNNQNGTFFDYDSDKFITISGAENFDKLDEEARQKIIEELDSMGYEYAPGDFEMLYGEPEETIDYTSAYPKDCKRVDFSSAYPKDSNQIDYTSAYPNANIINWDKVNADFLDDIIKELDSGIGEEETYKIRPIKTIWYNVKNGTADTIKYYMYILLYSAVYDYFAVPEETYSDMTNDVLKLNRVVITNHKLDLMIINILKSYPKEYARDVKKLLNDWNTDIKIKIKRYASKEQLMDLLLN